MSYTWTDGELITAEKLNNTGASNILICEASFDGDGYILDKTTQEIYDALLADIPAYIKFQWHLLLKFIIMIILIILGYAQVNHKV